MACLAAPATAAIITAAVKKKIPEKYHIEWLLFMLWGGVLVLLVDHIANGEIVPYYPFFTRGWSQIWPEILKIGIPMTAAIFLAWVSMLFGYNIAQKRKLKAA